MTAITCCALGVLILLVVVFWLPIQILDIRHLSLTPKDRLDAEAAIRTSLIQVAGGIAVIAGFYFTARTLRITYEGHITERYAKAIEQIGNENLDVRIGGLYALERLMRDSHIDRATIIEVLTAFVREHTREGPQMPSPEPIAADVQAALTILARRPNVATESGRLDFYFSGLNHANFRSGSFSKALFLYCRLNQALFADCDLQRADLSFCEAIGAGFNRCIARHAHFVNASYTNGWFLGADLTHADFHGCDLSGSDFGRRYAEEGNPSHPPAIMEHANLTKATLTNTNLRGVDLRTVKGLTKEQLSEAIIDSNTLLPEGLRDSRAVAAD